jgi:phage gp29-like protein
MSETTTPPAEVPRAAIRIARVRLKTEVATLATDPNAWTWGGRLEPKDAVLVPRGGRRALAHYKALKRDPRVDTVLGKRKSALVGREWELEPADESAGAAQAAERVREALKPLAMSKAVGDLLEALLLGYLPGEVMWDVGGGLVVPAEIRPRDPERFVFRDDSDGKGPQLRLLVKGNIVDGVEVPPMKFVVHRHRGEFGDPYGLGLGHQLFWPCFFKRQGIGFWLNGLEKFGQPTAVGKYPNGTSDPDQEKLLAALSAIASDTGVAIPEGMAVELLEAKRAGSFDSYNTLVRYFDEEITLAVLGETLTSTAGDRGSQSLGKVHNEVRLELTKADGDALAETLNASLIPWVAALNGVGENLVPRIWWKVEEGEDLNQRAERDTKIKGLGFRPTLEYITGTYGEGWEEAPAPEPPPGAPPGPPPMPPGLAAAFAEAAMAARAATLPAADDGRDNPERVADLLDRRTAGQQEALLRPVIALMERAATLQEVADGLATLYPRLDTERLGEAMAQAMILASLLGRDDLAAQGA